MRGKREDTHSVRYQGYQRLESYFAAGKGTSKHADKQTPQQTAGKIYSDTTLHTYKRAWTDFCDSMKAAGFKANGHTPRTFEEAAGYVPAYIEELKARPGSKADTTMSAWSIRTYFAGVGKVLDLSARDYDLPARHIEDITRSREDCVRDAHFSESRHADLLEFCDCTGLRCNKELLQIHGSDLIERDDGSYAIAVTGKGGRYRELPVIGSADEVQRVVDRMHEAGDGRVWEHVSNAADIHEHRAEYAQRLYDSIARDPRTLDPEERYCCRGSKTGTWYDREALRIVSEALGHSRVNIVAEHYLWRRSEDDGQDSE